MKTDYGLASEYGYLLFTQKTASQPVCAQIPTYLHTKKFMHEVLHEVAKKKGKILKRSRSYVPYVQLETALRWACYASFDSCACSLRCGVVDTNPKNEGKASVSGKMKLNLKQ